MYVCMYIRMLMTSAFAQVYKQERNDSKGGLFVFGDMVFVCGVCLCVYVYVCACVLINAYVYMVNKHESMT
jgi:hypothetical protein